MQHHLWLRTEWKTKYSYTVAASGRGQIKLVLHTEKMHFFYYNITSSSCAHYEYEKKKKLHTVTSDVNF